MQKAKLIPLYPSVRAKPVSGRVLACAVAAFSLAAAGIVVSSQHRSEAQPAAPMTADQCIELSYKNLVSRFSQSTQAQKDDAWSSMTLDCVNSFGLPENITTGIDADEQGRARYFRDISPTGF